MSMLANFLYTAFPYLAITIFVVGCIVRYRLAGFKYSSLSSQFLDSEKLFFGSMLFHWSLVILFLAHLAAFLFPSWILALNSNPQNLLIYESIGFIFGLSAVLGLAWLIVRRLANERVRMVTSRMDIVIELLVLAQLVIGCWIAFNYRWGSSWFASDLTPYLWSIFAFNPQTAAVAEMPTVVLIHIVVAFIILGLIPFTRLVHILVAPFSYITRPYQQVFWNWDRKRRREASAGWVDARPRNN